MWGGVAVLLAGIFPPFQSDPWSSTRTASTRAVGHDDKNAQRTSWMLACLLVCLFACLLVCLLLPPCESYPLVVGLIILLLVCLPV